MKALQITSYGSAPRIVDAPELRPGPAEVVVQVAGAALNPLDLKLAAGQMQDYFPVEFPYTMGTDVSGTVSALGGEVTGWAVGDPIVARTEPTRGGAFAEAVVVPSDLLVAAPSSVALVDAAGIATAAATAWQALTEVADVRPGQTVLVHAGAGGVGSFAVQFARMLGAVVTATASGAGLDICRELGAHRVIDYNTTDFRASVSDLDVVLDTVGGDVEALSLEVLKPGGLLVAVPSPPDESRAQAFGVRAEFFAHASDARRLRTVVDHVDAGIRVLVDRTVPLLDGAAALEYLARGHAKGKVILVPDEPS